MLEFDKVYSVTWPFETLHNDIPQRFIIDANIIDADSCVINSILVSAGCITVIATITKGVTTTEVSSGVQDAVRSNKIKLYNSVGKCFGWLLLGDQIPQTYTLSDVSYDLCATACIPFAGMTSATDEGITGDWTIEGENGVTITPSSTNPLVLSFDADEESFTVPSPNDRDKSEGNGIYSINGLGGTVTISVTNGLIVPKTESGKLRSIVVVPPLVYYSNKPDNTFTQTTTFPNPTSETTWNNGYGDTVVLVNNQFKITLFGEVTYIDELDTTYVKDHNGVKRLDTLATMWTGCDLTDYFRTIIKDRYEVPTSYPLPLDPIVDGQ